jgi:hypothetical protein
MANGNFKGTKLHAGMNQNEVILDIKPIAQEVIPPEIPLPGY